MEVVSAGRVAVLVNDATDTSETVLLPREQIRFGAFPNAVLIRKYPAGSGIIKLTYSPPGASCLPLPLLLVPYKP